MLKQPLADRIRPESFGDMVGDPKLFGAQGIFSKMIDAKHIPNMIFYGPSGTGKTTAANILAAAAGKTLHKLNATSAGLADVKQVIAESTSLLGTDGVLLYLDEMQYFNKKQQQSLLEFIENGRITLIASTTENPYFYIYPAIISRCAVFEFKPIGAFSLKQSLVTWTAWFSLVAVRHPPSRKYPKTGWASPPYPCRRMAGHGASRKVTVKTPSGWAGSL